ncbi:TIGR02221 family CRISPR-associated protein [Leptotrichia buccalis]
MEKGKSRKVFLSFLGLGNYEKCVYTFEKEKSKNVKFVQNAIVEICKDKFDKKFVLCTPSAKNTHYNSLVNEIGHSFEAINISEDMSEKGIWEIFQQIYDVLNENDEVVFDITHSFRFMPMLGITLLQMAKFLKNIKVKKVFYGAYEPNKFKNGITEFPLVDLTSFSMLQDWILAGYTLVNTGRAEEIEKLAKNDLTPILKESKGKNEEALNFRKIADKIQQMTLNFRTNRGNETIAAREMKNINESVKKIRESNLLKPFKLVIENIHSDTQKFAYKSEENIIHSIQWCIDKDLVQQGMTMLQEGISTLVLEEIGEQNQYNNINIRSYVSHILQNISNPSGKFKKNLSEDPKSKELEKKILNIKEINKLSEIYLEIANLRNDINHAGFRNNPLKAQKFSKKLKENFKKFKEIWENKNDVTE